MKKITLLLLFLFTSWHINAQIGIMEGLNSTTLPTGWTQSGFSSTTTTPCEGTHAWRKNFYSFSTTGSLTSTNYVAASNATDVNVSFAWQASEYSLGNGVGFTVNAEFSIDNGTTWQAIGSPISANDIAACDIFAAVIPAASVPMGSDFKFRVSGIWDSGDCYFWIDNISITQTAFNPPACTTLSAPINGAIDVSSSIISWTTATGIPTGYKLNVGTTPGATNVLNLFDVGNVLTYNLGTLASSTTYYVTVIPYNANGNSVGPCTESSFTTCAIIAAPATENFSTYIPNCWQEADNGDAVAGPATFGSSGWGADGFGNVGTTGAINYNVYTTGANDWIVSPLYSIPAVGYELKFDAAATQWAATTAPTTPWGADDSIEVLVSTGTTNWTVLYTYNDTNIPSNTGTTNIIDLDAYAGQNVRFAFRAIEGAVDGLADIDFSIDNFELRLTPSCSEPIGLAVSGLTPNAANITWSATTGNYEYVLDNAATNPVGAGTAFTATTYNASGLSESTTYYFHVRSVCAGPTYSPWSTVSFTTPASPPVNDDCASAMIVSSLPYNFTQNASAATNNAGFIAQCAFGMNDGVWYTFNVATSGNVNISLTGVTGWDPEVGVYSGSCGTFTCVGTVDSGGTGGAETLNLPALASGQYWINIGHYSGSTNFPEGPLTIDLTGSAVLLGTNSFDNANFSYYPNPVKNMLNLSYTENISDVAVYNLLGQQVIAKAINANQSQIDMSHLSSGAYMVKVTADNQVKMIKVIKE